MAESHSESKLLWFIAGTALGASIALLYAPLSGEETRKTLVRKTGEGRAALAGSGKDMLDRGREMFERGRQLAEEAADMFEKGRVLLESTAANLEPNI